MAHSEGILLKVQEKLAKENAKKGLTIRKNMASSATKAGKGVKILIEQVQKSNYLGSVITGHENK